MKNKRIFFYFSILILFFFIIILRIFYIRIKIYYPHTKNSILSRGLILDRNGNYLAINKQVTSVYMNPSNLETKNLADNLSNLSKILNIKKTDLIDKIKLKKKFIWLKRKVQNIEIINQIKKLNMAGIHFKKELIRYYPYEESLSHVIGFVGEENAGLEGLEYSLNKELNPKSKSYDKSIIYGQNIHLTIDITIQQIIEKYLKEYLNEYQAKHGLVIIMKSNGEIISLANYPNYNPNNFHNYSPSDYRNISISNYYEPGSLFKILTAAILLENNLVNLKEQFYCSNKIKIYNRIINCSTEHGYLNLEEILKKSCINIVKLSNRISKERMYNFLKSLKFGQKTDITLSGESSGHLKPLTQFTPITKSMISFGYEIGATPIQIIQAINSILNGGILYPINIIKHIEEDGSENEEEGRRIISKKTSKTLRKMLESVMEPGGTGHSSQYYKFKNLKILGKTSTVRIYNQVLNQYTKSIHTGFFGMIPLKTKDFLSILIMINHPEKGGQNSSKIAVPVFYTLIEDLINKDLIHF